MEQLVRVRNVFPDGTAEVLLVRESACSGDCHKCSGCGAAKETMIFTARNAINASRGDLVKVESATGPVMKAAMVLPVYHEEGVGFDIKRNFEQKYIDRYLQQKGEFL